MNDILFNILLSLGCGLVSGTIAYMISRRSHRCKAKHPESGKRCAQHSLTPHDDRYGHHNKLGQSWR